MAYSIDQASAVATQLEKFATSYAHHLVGQFANMQFWLDEANHALKVIDDYSRRFDLMREAQRTWIKAHGTVVSGFCPHCGGKCEFDPRTPEPPTRLPSREMDEARRRLKDASYHFLLRCYRTGLLDEAALKTGCAYVGTSIDPADLKASAK